MINTLYTVYLYYNWYTCIVKLLTHALGTDFQRGFIVKLFLNWKQTINIYKVHSIAKSRNSVQTVNYLISRPCKTVYYVK